MEFTKIYDFAILFIVVYYKKSTLFGEYKEFDMKYLCKPQFSLFIFFHLLYLFSVSKYVLSNNNFKNLVGKSEL